MFSNDGNIETIAQLVEAARRYVQKKGEYLRLDIFEKTVKVLTVLIMGFILFMLLLLILIYLSFCVAYALAPSVGHVGAFAIVGGFYVLLLIACVANRKRWIERPLVRFMASLFME